ncbi:acyltransferase family protein [Lysobacter sp. Root494]|uniref:acyltransferase family protein n=1 Tax=Lysobacter sp. Root494 TaxID=1736549 RepID=UPI0006FA2416|nr:acyltransferase family protein [Lysobacter sp. Root494]KQY49814.1 hypothetical protein ASD14_13925 [Lysobacter sp. Root494]
MQIRDEHGGFRPEIQGLRAIAVLLVLVYHLWPSWLPGGYTGVDVFFVISGYLITALLLRELETRGGISLPRFYVRRARRLLPAAVLTLMVVLAATLVLLPVTEWRGVAQETGAAALYFENWWLAFKAVDYLAIEASASPVQHFWSLSVEEQYYFVWPALLAGLYAFARRFAPVTSFRSFCAACLALIVAGSLAYSVKTGLSGETAAYFSSFTRIWQLAAGGLLAVAGASAGRARVPVLLLGLAGILAAALFLSDDTAYPGYAALLPTVATLLAIQAGAAFPHFLATRWLGARPVQYLGDISYSLYLWHWPLIVFAKHYYGDRIGILQGIVIALAAVALAGLSKRFVEDTLRKPGVPGTPSWKPLSIAAAASLACVAFAWGVVRQTGSESGSAAVADTSAYPGAMAMLSPGPVPAARVDFLPALPNVEDDVSVAYAEGCIQGFQGAEVKTCVYGRDNAKTRIAVVGDSHAVHWLPAFAEMARLADVQVVGITKTTCIAADVPLFHPKLKGPYASCQKWAHNVVAYLNDHDFDYIVLSQSPRHRLLSLKDKKPKDSAAALAHGMQELWSQVARGRDKIVVFRSTPWQPTEVRDCFASHPGEADSCTGSQADVMYQDAMSLLAKSAGYRLVDFTDLFCRDGKCPAVIGNVFVYRDAHHVTATYMRTMAPLVAERMGIPGADAVAAGIQMRKVPSFDGVNPSPMLAKDDRGDAFADKCVQSLRRDQVVSCTYGEQHGQRRVVVVGDSMGANLVPGLKAAAQRNGWRLDTFFKDSCLFSATPVYNRRLKRAFGECSRWAGAVVRRLQAEPADLVVLVQSPQYIDSRRHSYEQASPALERGIATYVSQLSAKGSGIAVVRYMPWMPFDVPQCLMTRGDAVQCRSSRTLSTREGPLLSLANRTPGIAVLDINDAFCGPQFCDPIRDGVLVYRDAMQPTATFARTLEDEFSAQLVPLLAKGRTVPDAASLTLN